MPSHEPVAATAVTPPHAMIAASLRNQAGLADMTAILSEAAPFR